LDIGVSNRWSILLTGSEFWQQVATFRCNDERGGPIAPGKWFLPTYLAKGQRAKDNSWQKFVATNYTNAHEIKTGYLFVLISAIRGQKIRSHELHECARNKNRSLIRVN